jgi:plasmid stabilization system protein ParE
VKLRWTIRARDDLRQVRRYIARDRREAADRWVRRLRKRAQGAARAPRSGRIVPELHRDDVREVFVGSYRVVYRIERDAVVILTVFEGHRLLPGRPGPARPAE